MNSGTVIKICDFGTVTDKSTLMTNNRGEHKKVYYDTFGDYAQGQCS